MSFVMMSLMRPSKPTPSTLATLLALALSLSPLSGPAAAKPQPKSGAQAGNKAASPAALPAPVITAPQFVRELGGIEEYRLANGLQILLFPDEAQSTTTVNITYRVGSRHESQGEYGMAHLLEHLLFKGTPSNKDIPGAFAQRGVRFNGTTTTDRTNYFASFNASEDTLDFLLGLEADRMVHSFIAKSDLDKEMSVVRNEFERGENNPSQVLLKRVQAVAYDWHAYGHATIGPKSDIENVPIEKLQAFYQRYYRPDNATLLVAGRFDKAAALQRIAQRFGPVLRPAQDLAQPYTEEPAQDGERMVTVRRVGGQPLLLTLYHVPAAAQADSAALIVLGQLMALPPGGLLYKELVESKQAVFAAMVGMGGYAPGGLNVIAALPPDADVAKVEQRLLDLVEGRAGKPFDEAELARVRELALNGYREQMKKPEALIQQISNLLGAGDWRLLFQLMEDIPKVTLADVERVRKTYLVPANRTLGRYLPASAVERVEIPPAPPLEQRLAELKGPPKVEAGERFDPTPVNLAERTQRKTLPSGIELSTLAKRTRGNAVDLQLQLRWGERDATYARLGTGMVGQLMSEGSRSLDKQALRDALTRLRASLSIQSGDQGATLRLTAEQDTLLDALKIAAELLQHPLLAADAFERVRQATVSQLQASRQELETLREEAVRGHYNQAMGAQPGQPDYLMSLDDRISLAQKMTLQDVRGFHADYWSANSASIAVVGALPSGLEAAIEQFLGGWKKPAAPAFQRHLAAHVEIPPARLDVLARDKANAALRMRLDFALSEKDVDALPLEVAVYIFGAGGMESRLSTRVRQQEGLSYGIGAGLRVPTWGTDADLVISGSFAPQNRDKVLTLVQQELARMGEQGISEAELERARTAMLEARRQNRASDAVLGGQLLRQAELGQSWDDAARRDARLQALTVEQVNAAWRRFVQPAGFVISTVGDFKDQQPGPVRISVCEAH
jgi:zinc protease